MLTKRERVLRTALFEETDRVPIYDIPQNDALIAHLAGEAVTPANGYRVKGRAIGCAMDMTRMPEGPAEPETRVEEDGLIVQVERWTSWIIARLFTDAPQMIEWVTRKIDRAESQRFDLAYAQALHAWMDDCAGYAAAGDPTGRGDPPVQVIESGVGLTEIYHRLGWEHFTTLMMEQPDLLEASGTGIFLGSTTELHWDVWPENALAMFGTAWEDHDGTQRTRHAGALAPNT